MTDATSEAIYVATLNIRHAAAALIGLAPEEPNFLLYGPGFEITITRTDPNADYPGKAADGKA